MKQCAFCGGSAPFTREHVIPRFLYDCVDRQALPNLLGWNDATESRVGGQHTVKDVCANCNSTALSKLDGYGKSFLESNALLKPLYVDSMTIGYDYDLLMRWLLKITFNSARASGNPDHPVAQQKRYIITGEDRPNVNRCFALLELLRPHYHPDGERDNAALINSEGLSNPFFVRLTATVMSLKQSKRVSINSIGFGGLWFHLVFLNRTIPIGPAKQERRAVLRSHPAWVPLLLNTSSVHVAACGLDWLQVLLPQAVKEHILSRKKYAFVRK